VTTHFDLLGDGNMHFMAAMAAAGETRMVAVRHERCALLMAVGYLSATGLPGVCSVTHGPGFAQLMTGLTTAARNNAAVVVLSDGDGGLLMHVQELETLVGEGIRLLVICINDGAYGAEVHKLRADGVDAEGAIFGHTDLTALASVFGLGVATITDHAQVRGTFVDFENDERAWLWDVKVSGLQQSPPMRAGLAGRGAQL
jgi:thiamine pyrophosphate-dependent acetolactate synthase large subunit-like protein